MPMKAAVIKSNSNIEIKNIEKPPVGPGDMLVTNTESIGMILLVACLVGVIASVVGIRMYILFKK